MRPSAQLTRQLFTKCATRRPMPFWSGVNGTQGMLCKKQRHQIEKDKSLAGRREFFAEQALSSFPLGRRIFGI